MEPVFHKQTIMKILKELESPVVQREYGSKNDSSCHFFEFLMAYLLKYKLQDILFQKNYL